MAKNKTDEPIISFNVEGYNTELEDQKKYIKNKRAEFDRKLTSLRLKEEIVNRMILESNNQVEKQMEVNNWKVVNIINAQLLTQFETLNQIQEMLCKYEDMIQKYLKMIIDIENHKVNTFVKLASTKKEADNLESSYENLMQEMHKITSNVNTNMHVDFAAEVKNQLKLEGY